MDLIIHKLLDDALTLLSECWQALWHGTQPACPDEASATPVEHGSQGTTHPLV